ncbi:EboA domain-containing protein [Streptomyces sp. H27-C3]|uniref:EboA domain-containing protein n=1 Tax=Streptomyces sp. H27-C3 TaxID=3046305 RepID=UPI0024BB10AB|nr:EboA domain-containing protein [Streptomyces sp. H27-C3]MDJ0462742.1 EboA domain-containing protein [Streptomyces sp. H27-C3]
MLTDLIHSTTATTPALQAALEARLGGAGRAWLHEGLAEAEAAAAASPGPADDSAQLSLPTWEIRFAEAGRHCRPAPDPDGGTAPDGPDLTDVARVLLLHTVGADHTTADRLYAHGTAAERRAVLLALPHLGGLGADALPLVEDALRTNDTRLVAAAVGPYAFEHLDQHAWRHAVLKCLFTGVPVAAVDGLALRAQADSELARMLRDYAAERTAAGRPVPDDLHRVLSLTATAAPTEES